MLSIREPVLKPVAISKLRPTQITVGMREVNEKRERWRHLTDQRKVDFLGNHMIPVIHGPKQRDYIIDHHHLARALLDEGAEHVFVVTVADLSSLDQDAFWTFLDHHAWVFPYDAKGKRRGYNEIPRTVSELKDDPFRSVAGELRRIGGYAKDTTPFSEFLWADFLRRQLKRSQVEKNFSAAMKKAYTLARGQDAKYLPGWCGAIDS
jgi:hypothetical protein